MYLHLIISKIHIKGIFIDFHCVVFGIIDHYKRVFDLCNGRSMGEGPLAKFTKSLHIAYNSDNRDQLDILDKDLTQSK